MNGKGCGCILVILGLTGTALFGVYPSALTTIGILLLIFAKGDEEQIVQRESEEDTEGYIDYSETYGDDDEVGLTDSEIRK